MGGRSPFPRKPRHWEGTQASVADTLHVRPFLPHLTAYCKDMGFTCII